MNRKQQKYPPLHYLISLVKISYRQWFCGLHIPIPFGRSFVPWWMSTYHFYSLNNFMKHWLILIILSKHHQEKNLTQLTLVLSSSPQYCDYTTLRNAEVVLWPLTTMNSYWVSYALAQKITETTKIIENLH